MVALTLRRAATTFRGTLENPTTAQGGGGAIWDGLTSSTTTTITTTKTVTSATSAAAAALLECAICPISGDVMRDPVVVHESGITYDRESLCLSLLAHPDLDPGTNQRFPSRLHYVSNIAVRGVITAMHGDACYQRFDDDDFHTRYNAVWRERERRRTPPLGEAVVVVVDVVVADPPAEANGGDGGGRELRRREAAAAGGGEGEDRRWWSTRLNMMLVVQAAAVMVGLLLGGSKFVPIHKAPPSIIEKIFRASLPATTIASHRDDEDLLRQNFLSTLPAKTTESLRDAESPQYRAYQLVTQSDFFPRRKKSRGEDGRLFRMTQRFALATLFHSIRGLERWIDATVSECLWGYASNVKVMCDANSRIVSIRACAFLGGGALPPEIGLLTGLTSLELDSNSLTSSIPTELGMLTDLELLGLLYNSLTSSVPTELGNLSALTQLLVANNELTSSVPNELGRLEHLGWMWLENNRLTGTVPSALCRVRRIDADRGLKSSCP